MKKNKKKIKHLFVLIFLIKVFAFTGVFAQTQITVTGLVTDSQEALPGVSVTVKNENRGTITDTDGRFSIGVTADDILVFSFIGFEYKEVAVSGRTVIDVAMQEFMFEIDEVVAIGYGTVRRRDLTGAVSTVGGDDLARRNVSSITQALQGQLAGVQISSTGGTPGREASVLVRGIATINNNNPLYIVDDIPLDDISWLNPKDIENVQVLKDASSSAIFGSRASNGVIIIQTKNAEVGRTDVSFDAVYSIHQVAKDPKLADAWEYAEIANAAALNSGRLAPFEDPASLGSGTNWWNEVTQIAPVHNYLLSINKATEEMRISSSVSYFNQEGVIKGGGYERLTLRLNAEYDLNNWLTIGQSLNISKDNTKNGPGLVWDAIRAEPVVPVFLPEYEQEGRNQYSVFHPMTRTDLGNPMGQLARSYNQTDYFRTVGNLFVKADFGGGFSGESRLGFYFSSWENNWFSPEYYIEPTDRGDVNSVGRTHNNRTNYTLNNLLHYSVSANSHQIQVTAGNTIESFEHRTLSGSGNQIPSNHVDLRYLDAATTGLFAGGTDARNTLTSFLGRVNYNYDHRYLLTATIRADGSSRFNKDNRWGYFPSVSGAWNVSEELFMEQFYNLSQLKIRAGWGQVGNQNIANDALLTTMGRTVYVLGSSQSVALGMAPSSVGNTDLKWETVEDVNIGLDMGLYNHRLTLSFDYFEKRSRDMLMQMSIPAYLGSAFSTPWSNVGRLTTKGFELVTRYRHNVSNDLAFNYTLNLSRATSKMTNLAYGEDIYSGNHQRLDMLTRTREGGVAGAFYGWATDGIFQNEAEVLNHTDEFGNLIQPNAQPGDMRFKDINGDGRLTDEDRVEIGNPEPDFIFGFNFGVEYGSFDLGLLFTGVYGNDVLNAVKPYTHPGNGIYNAYKGLLNDAWSPENPTNKQPRLAVLDPNNNFRYSDYYIEDGSYLRLTSAQIGYNLPLAMAQRIGMSRARIYIGGENLFTLTNFSGLDPDMGGSALQRGIDWGHYPQPRVYMIGANITF